MCVFVVHVTEIRNCLNYYKVSYILENPVKLIDIRLAIGMAAILAYISLDGES